jgi:hypothetical protein
MNAPLSSERCAHEQMHYMGCGPLPYENPECRWNYVCRKCLHWFKFKQKLVLGPDDRHGKLPKPTYVSKEHGGALAYGVPAADKVRKASKRPVRAPPKRRRKMR